METQPRFLYMLKAPRLITCLKRLAGTDEMIPAFWRSAALLEGAWIGILTVGQ
jgi:uncharacterized protein YecE (DUF72 family)